MKKKIYLLSCISLITVSLTFLSCGNQSNKTGTTTSEQVDDQEEPEEEEFQAGDYFKCEDGNFKVRFPGEPEKSKEMVPTEVGNLELITYSYEKSATEVVMVAYADYPSSMMEGQDEYDLLKSSKDGALEDMTNSIDVDQTLEIEGYPAVYCRAKGDYYVIYEAVLVDNRLYQIMMARDGSYPDEEFEQEFIGSFKLLDK